MQVTSDQRAALLGRLIAGHHDQLLARPKGSRRRLAGLGGLLGGQDPDVGAAFDAELRMVLGSEGIADLAAPGDDLAARVTRRLAEADRHHVQVLWALAGGDDRLAEAEQVVALAPSGGSTPARTKRRLPEAQRTWMERQFAALVLNLLIAAVPLTIGALLWFTPAEPPAGAPAVLLLKTFALWCLSFLPCWLYIRFLGQRAGALWAEYVLNLHRLGWDEPRFLPRPVRTSQVYEEWAADGGRREAQDRNIYRQKFNAYFGREVADNASDDDFRVRLDTMFPVLLTAVVLAACWAAVLWEDQFLRAPESVWDVLKFAFLGAYVFIVQMLLRRFFASDLRPSAYTSALLRITVVLVSIAALYQVLEIWFAGVEHARRWEAAVAFVIGFFPLVATQVLLRVVSTPLRMSASKLESDYPLDQLDGLSIWYEARLVEENIEDMQNLATANLVDVLLHTRVPVGRLVDWVDQAYLYLHLDRVERGIYEARQARRSPDGAKPAGKLVAGSTQPNSRCGTRIRTGLRQIGIRTATDLIKAFPPDLFDPFLNGTAAPVEPCPLDRLLAAADIDCDHLRMLVRVLSEEQGLAPVWNWHDRGVRARCHQRIPRSVQDCAAQKNGGSAH